MRTDNEWRRDGPWLRLTRPDFRVSLMAGTELRAPIDAIVELNDAIPRFATLFTWESMRNIQTEHQKSGECLHGRYFWSDHLILIDSENVELIEKVVTDLVETGEIERAFGVEQASPES